MCLFPINVDISDFNTHGLEIVFGFMDLVGDIQKSFGGNATNIETGSSKRASLFNADCVKSELGGLDCGHVTFI